MRTNETPELLPVNTRDPFEFVDESEVTPVEPLPYRVPSLCSKPEPEYPTPRCWRDVVREMNGESK